MVSLLTRPLLTKRRAVGIGPAPLYHPDLDVVVYYSPKAASTVVTLMFFQATGLLDEALDYHPFAHRFENHVYKRRPDYRAGLVEAIRNGAPVVKFVRDPLARALSMYLELMRPVSERYKGHHKPWFDRYRTRILADLDVTTDAVPNFSFWEFLSWRARQDNSRLNNHLKEQARPGSEWLTRPQLVPVETFPGGLAPYPRLLEAYKAVAERGLLDSPHHKPKATMTDAETLEAIRDRRVREAMPPLSLAACPSRGLSDLVARAFPRDVRRLACFYGGG